MLKRIPRILTILAVMLIPLLWMSGQAQAAPVVNISVAAPSPIWPEVEVTVQITGLTDSWKGTAYAWNDSAEWTCVGRPNVNPPMTSGEVTFTAEAPLTPGPHTLNVAAYNDNACQDVAVAQDNGVVGQLDNNPDIPESCGLDIILVLDESAAIQPPLLNSIRDSAKALWDALEGTGSSLAVVEFSDIGRLVEIGGDGTDTNAGRYIAVIEANRAAFETYLDGLDANSPAGSAGYGPGAGSANWEDALLRTQQINETYGQAAIVFFFSNGQPTSSNSPADSTPEEWTAAAIDEANTIKNTGSKIFGIGTTSTAYESLPNITGVDKYDPTLPGSIAMADYAESSAGTLSSGMTATVFELCQSSVTVNKKLWNSATNQYDIFASDWRFDALIETLDLGGSFAWLEPGNGDDDAGTNHALTGEDENMPGVLLFQWDPSSPTTDTDVTITETNKLGFTFIGYNCKAANPTTGPVAGDTTDAALTVGPRQFWKCDFNNYKPDLGLALTADPVEASPGETVTYTMDWSVMAPEDYIVGNVIIENRLHPDLSFVPFDINAPPSTTSSEQCAAEGQVVTCDLDEVEVSNNLDPVNIVAKVRPGNYARTLIPNVACINGRDEEEHPLYSTDPREPNSRCASADITTPVTVAYFRVTSAADGLVFEWSTATETGNAGFNLYAETDGGLVQVNEELILSQAVDSGQQLDYSYAAPGANGELFYIEDVGVFGDRRKHGPFALGETYGAQLEADPIDWTAVRAENQALEKARRAAAPQPVEQVESETAGFSKKPLTGRLAHPQFELRVREDGIYRVTFEDLETATGVALRGVPARSLALTNNGQAVPMRILGGRIWKPGSYIEFLGKALDTLYTEENVYLLQVNRDRYSRMPAFGRVLAPDVKIAGHYMETAAFEQNNEYSYLAPSGDPWYDTLLFSKKPQSWSYTLDVDHYVSGAAQPTLNLELWGVNDTEHHVTADLNGAQVANLLFANQAVESAAAPANNLQNGANSLKLTVLNDRGAEFDMSALEAYGLTYPRAFVARDGRLTFTSAADAFTVSGLSGSNVLVYRDDRLGGPERLNLVNTQKVGDGYSATFAGRGLGTYYVSAVEDLLKPAISLAPAGADITSGSPDLLIISHPNFIKGLAPLVQARQAQGYKVKVVDVNAVYHAFSGGIFDAEALRLYINHAVEKMGVDYVLLVGADTINYRGYGGSLSMSFIPSLYAQTGKYVHFAPVDPLYTDVDGDNVPDAAIGRFPVRTTAELATLVQKTLTYDKKTYNNSAVFAADQAFSQQSDEFISALGSAWSVDEAYLDTSGLKTARKSLIDSLNEGVALTSFVGHSGRTNWTFDPLFTSNDAAALTNYGRPTVVSQWGCWNTYYVDPEFNTLGHKFLLTGSNGAAVVAGSTTLTDAYSEYKLGLRMMPLLSKPGMTTGEAMLAAKKNLAETEPALLDVLLGWTILGDPTTVVRP